MKRFVSIMLVLMLMISSASATSLFPAINTQLTQQKPELALSYGVMANVAPSQIGVDLSADLRGNFQLYKNVTEDGYHAFGTYLGENGYVLTGQKYTETSVQVIVGKGDITMTVVYEPTTLTLYEVYPFGVEFETYDPLKSYIEVTPGTAFNLNNLVTITIKSASYHSKVMGVYPVVWLDMQNLTSTPFYTTTGITVQLHIFKNGNHYVFDCNDSGRGSVIHNNLYLSAGVLNAMEKTEIGYSFNKTKTDIEGMNPDRIAITFSSGYSQYVYNVR